MVGIILLFSCMIRKVACACLLVFNFLHAQGQITDEFYFSLNLNLTRCNFTSDAIYLYGGNSLVKTDYSGNIIWSKSSSAAFSNLITSGNMIFGIDGLNIF